MTEQEIIEKAKELISHAEELIAGMDSEDYVISSIQDNVANLLGDLTFLQFDDEGFLIEEEDDDDDFETDFDDDEDDIEDDDDFDDGIAF